MAEERTPIPVCCTDLRSSGFTYIEADTLITTGPCRLEGVVVNVDANAHYATIYQGRDATSGRVIAVIKALAGRSVMQNVIPPIYCPLGIYVTLSAQCKNVSIFWSPVE